MGLDFIEDGRAFALADFDHDGRLEVFLKNRNGPQLRLLRNVMKDLGPAIAFRLRGGKSNRDAIGAAITVETGSGRQTRMLQAGSGFLSQHSKEVFFGLGDAKGPVQASIRWPSGLVQELRDLPLNHRVWVEEGSAPSRLEAFKANPQGLKPPALAARGGTAEAVPFHKIPLQGFDSLPATIETWLLAPVAAPDFSLSDLNGQARTLTALRGQPVLLNFWVTESSICQQDLKVFNRLHARWAAQGLHFLAVNLDDPADAAKVRSLARESHFSFSILQGSDDVAGIYNILYRYLFDRHRDLSLPTSFLINGGGEIVKVYQGPVNPEQVEQDLRHIPQTAAERMAKALPFPGLSDTLEFHRNYLNYGSIYFQRGYLEQAEASFRLALRDDPESAEALYGLGSVYLKQEKGGEARQSFERAIKLQASYPDTVANCLEQSWPAGHAGRAHSRSDSILPGGAQTQSRSLDRARESGERLPAAEELGRSPQALERAVAVGPQDAEANYSLGMVFAQLNDTDRAYEYLQRALKSRPGYPEALNNLGVLYLRTGRRDQAVASFEECIRVAPAFDQSYMNLARVYALEGTPDKARSVLLELLKQHPGHAQAQKALEQLQ